MSTPEIDFRNMRAEITRKGWTIEQFCAELGIVKRTFYDWEAKKDFPVKYLLTMAQMFGVSMEYVLGVQPTAAPK